MSTIASRLKAETEEQHLALERAMMPLAKGATSAAGYARLLQGMYAYLAPVEEKVLERVQDSTLPDRQQRRNIGLMKQDLQNLGAEPDAALKPELPEIGNEVQALGALYVLEGSTLGGQVVAQMLRKFLPEDAQHLSYFQSYGKETRAMWNAFRESLDRYAEAHPEAQDTIVEAATHTFTYFRQWLESYSR